MNFGEYFNCVSSKITSNIRKVKLVLKINSSAHLFFTSSLYSLLLLYLVVYARFSRDPFVCSSGLGVAPNRFVGLSGYVKYVVYISVCVSK